MDAKKRQFSHYNAMFLLILCTKSLGDSSVKTLFSICHMPYVFTEGTQLRGNVMTNFCSKRCNVVTVLTGLGYCINITWTQVGHE